MLNASESPTFAFVFKTTEKEQVQIQDFLENKKKKTVKINFCLRRNLLDQFFMSNLSTKLKN